MTVIRAVLFDFDGTLADTAPDLGHALNLQLERHGRAPVALQRSRPLASRGARGMLEAGFDITPEHANYEALRDEYLDIYATVLHREARLFDEVHDMLEHLEHRALPWGIVTNKASRFTTPLVERLALARRAACVVSGDSAARNKPHPDTLLMAADQIKVPAHSCVYVGDDLRDAQAARAAGMIFVAARYGYLGVGSDPNDWQPDHIIDTPSELLALLPSQSL
jgi:phosphoglycolate phosphatase